MMSSVSLHARSKQTHDSLFGGSLHRKVYFVNTWPVNILFMQFSIVTASVSFIFSFCLMPKMFIKFSNRPLIFAVYLVMLFMILREYL